MEAEFYDVKERKKVSATVTDKVKDGKAGNERHALKGKTADGRNLTKFVSKADWDAAAV